MNEERLTCISVRLTDEEYKNILAKKEYTTMSGILRKLLNGYLKEAANDGQANG